MIRANEQQSFSNRLQESDTVFCKTTEFWPLAEPRYSPHQKSVREPPKMCQIVNDLAVTVEITGNRIIVVRYLTGSPNGIWCSGQACTVVVAMPLSRLPRSCSVVFDCFLFRDSYSYSRKPYSTSCGTLNTSLSLLW